MEHKNWPVNVSEAIIYVLYDMWWESYAIILVRMKRWVWKL